MNNVRGVLGDPPTLRAHVPLFTEDSSGEPGASASGGTAAAVTSPGYILGNVYEVLPEAYD